MTEFFEHLLHYWPLYGALFVVAAFLLKVYFFDIRDNTRDVKDLIKRTNKLVIDMKDNTDNDQKVKDGIKEELTLINRRFDHNTIVLEMIADKQKIKVPKFVK